MKSFKILSALLLMAFSVTAQENIKTMFYNILEFPEALPGGRGTILKNILDTYEPDIFMVCELQSQEGANIILNESLNSETDEYDAAPFVPNQSGGADLQQLIYWKKDKFTLLSSEILITTIRDINHYTLQLSTADGDIDPIILEIYVAHLKSSQGSANQNLRLDMVNQFTNSLESLDPNSFVLFAGDFNVYRDTEPAYQEILDPTNAIVMLDPINAPGSWNNNIDFQAIHTQSTRVSSSGFGAGAGGGMDDRFDFIMMSQNMQTNPALKYVEGTYFSYGNNGNCYNNDVRSEDCTGQFDQDLRDNIFFMSDHLPVVMTLETNKEIVTLSLPEVTQSLQPQLKSTVVSQHLTLITNETIAQNAYVTIYNTLGQKISTHPLTNNPSQIIPVAHLANGLYYLQISTTTSQPLKFLKTS